VILVEWGRKKEEHVPLTDVLRRLRPGRRSAPSPPPVLVGDHTDKLSRLRPIRHDPDDRPCREDIESGRPRGLGRLAG
jgi:hypothetical protein